MKSSSSLRSLFFLLCLIAVALAFPAARVSAVGDPCTLPGLTILTDPTGDESDMLPSHDAQSLQVAEPTALGPNKIAFTLKMASLSTVPADTYWPVQFKVGTLTYVARMSTFAPATPAAPVFEYYQGVWNSLAPNTALADLASNFNADGTITIVVPRSGVGNPALGSNLTEFLVRIAVNLGGALVTPDNMPNTFVGSGSYTIACGTAPGNAGPPRYFNYVSPQGIAGSVGEPSIGSNWRSEKLFSNSLFPVIPNGGATLFFGGFSPNLVRITFNDCSSPAGTLWEPKVLLTANTPRVFGDPILFTDHDTGRTFVSQLEGLTPAGSTTDITDNDGDSFTPSEGSGAPSCVDHQTIGGGRFHAPLAGTAYPNAVYYASQCVADATASLSLDGGRTFGPGVVMFTTADCGGLHGHLKVAPDGTAYVPDNACGGTDLVGHVDGQQAVIVSENNGATWAIRPIPGSTTQSDDDNSVGVASNSNTIYVGFQSGDGHPRIAKSTDKGLTWSAPFDVGTTVTSGGPILNTAFGSVVAGDPNRAAFAFFGTETGGSDWNLPGFAGVWYLYLASTFDGGVTWSTQNLTPGDPIQRGGICGDGACRNHLDFFDATIDREGRVLVGYTDGCVSASCINGGANDNTAKGNIARQSGGKGMYAAFDPNEPAIPGAPLVSGSVNGANTVVTLSWPVPDNGGSTITGYKVSRGPSATGPFTFLATTPVNNYTDTTFDPAIQNFYIVTAVNAIGEGPYCGAFHPLLVVAPPCVQPTGPFFDDLEPGAEPGWQVDTAANNQGPASPTWQVITDSSAHSASHSFFSDATTLDLKDDRLIAPPQNISSTTHLIFWHRFQFEDGFDGGVLEVSTDFGATWADVGGGSFVSGGYNGSISGGFGSPIAGRPAWTGGDATAAMSKVDVNLGAFAGFNVKVRFRLAADPFAGGSTPGVGWFIDDIEFTNLQACPIQLSSVVSSKTHGTAGTFYVILPLTGTRGVECRSGGATNDYTLIFTFPNNLTSVASASVTSGTGSVSSSAIGPNPNQYTVNLTGVTNAQYITVGLTGALDTTGATGPVSGTMGVLLGDTTANGSVNSSDISQTKAQSGTIPTASTFRTDVTINGLINSSDISTVKSKSGTALPSLP